MGYQQEVKYEYGLDSLQEMQKETFDAIILTVAHNKFINMDLSTYKKENTIIYDVKGVLQQNVDGKL